MFPALLLIPLVALFRIFLAWQPVGTNTWAAGFSPLSALALCAGLFMPRRWALVFPLGVLLLSDALIDAHYGHYYFFAWGTLANYALLAAIVLGALALRGAGWFRATGFFGVLGATLAGAVFFYMASNTAVWFRSPEYPQTLGGLVQALTVGIPGYPPSYLFFRNELVSDALYSMVFVACVRLTQPAQESNALARLPGAVAGADRHLVGARHQG